MLSAFKFGNAKYKTRDLLCYFAKYFDAFFNLLIACSVADTEMGIFFAKDIAGDDKDVIGDGFFNKFCGVAARGLNKSVKGAARLYKVEFILQAIIN